MRLVPALRVVRHMAVAAVGLLVAALAPAAQAGEQVEVRRLGGATRVETAVAISQATDRGIPQLVAVARADDFPDALVASYPAGAYGGPILLNPTDELHDAVREELLRLQVTQTRVTIFGGTSAISSRVAEQIDALGIDVHRLAAPTGTQPREVPPRSLPRITSGWRSWRPEPSSPTRSRPGRWPMRCAARSC